MLFVAKQLLPAILDQRVKVMFHKTQHTMMNWGKVEELHVADEHILVSFFRKRIPCKFLDKKYCTREVKHIAKIKIGLCWNPSCSLPERKADRSKMLYCIQCRVASLL